MHHAGHRSQEAKHGGDGRTGRDGPQGLGKVHRNAVAGLFHGVAHRHGALVTILPHVACQGVKITVGAAGKFLEGLFLPLLFQVLPESAQHAVHAAALEHKVVAVALYHQKPSEPPQHKDGRKHPPSPKEDSEGRLDDGYFAYGFHRNSRQFLRRFPGTFP